MIRASLCLLAFITAAAAQSSTTEADAALQQALHYSDLYNWADSGPFFAKAEALFTAEGDARNALYSHLGVIRSTMERRSLPRTSEELAHELEANPLLQGDPKLRMFCLSVKGDIDGEIDAAPMKRDWEEVRSLAGGFADSKWQNRATAEIGFAEFMEGQVDDARVHVTSALLRAANSHDMGAQIRYLAAIGTGFVLVHHYDTAVDYLQKSLKVSAHVPDAGYPFIAKEGMLQSLLGLNHLDEARSLATEIISEARKRRRLVKETQARITEARVEIAAHNPTEAIAQLRTAIRLATAGGFSRLLAEAEMTLAQIYANEGRPQLAESTVAHAVAIGRKNAEIYLLPQRLTLLAEMQVKGKRYSEAEKSYEEAGYLVDSMLGHVSSMAAKTGLIETMTDLYVGQFALLADDLHLPDKALIALEAARGRILMGLLLNGHPQDSPQLERAEQRISELRLRLAATSSPVGAARLRDQIFLAEQARWVAESGAKWPTQEVHVMAATDIRKRLQPDDVILEYVLADSRSYCLIMTNRALRIVPLSGRESIEKDVDAYIDAITKRVAGTREAKALYADLLGGVPEIAGHANVTVIPDGKLFLVPFDALMNPNGEYVLATHNVAYAPSANTLMLMRSREMARPAGGSLLAVGGVPYQQAKGITIGVLRGGPSPLSDLPGSKEEVTIATEVDPSERKTTLIGPAATESALKHADLEHRSIIHLAVHGIADTTHPDRAALVLLSDPAAGEDGLLEAPEITNMHLNAELVVLSACDTAAGRLQGEAGIANLSGAFLLAGAHTVVSTLWSVDDTFSVFLMKQFYSHLTKGDTVGSALANSKRDMLQIYGSRAVPYFWAGYVLEGVSDERVKTSEHKLYATN